MIIFPSFFHINIEIPLEQKYAFQFFLSKTNKIKKTAVSPYGRYYGRHCRRISSLSFLFE